LPVNDRETRNETTAIARQQLCKYASVLEPFDRQRPARNNENTIRSGIFYAVPSETISVDQRSQIWLVQYSAVEWRELVGE
jgi:hypothetical protein